MICKKCGSECPDGNIFCEACGAELDAPVLPENIDDKGRVRAKKKPKKEKIQTEKPVRKQRSPESRAAFVKKIKLGAVCLAVIAVIIIIVMLINALSGNEGYNAAQQIPLGRDVEFARSETGLSFEEKSSNGMINSMSDFDYICISEKTTTVSGSEQPQWVIMLTVGEDDRITDVEYYDFRQLKLNWKGRKMPGKLDQNSLEFGMSMKNVNKALGLKPYYIKRSVSNDSMYCYRYFYTDPEEGYDRSFNYYVEFSDIEFAVRGVDYREINYARTILSAGTLPEAGRDSDPAAETETSGEPSEDEENSGSDNAEE